jgi:hypothetical protein
MYATFVQRDRRTGVAAHRTARIQHLSAAWAGRRIAYDARTFVGSGVAVETKRTYLIGDQRLGDALRY